MSDAILFPVSEGPDEIILIRTNLALPLIDAPDYVPPIEGAVEAAGPAVSNGRPSRIRP